MHAITHLTKKLKHKILEFTEFSAVGVSSLLIMFFLTMGLTELTPLNYKVAYGFGLFTSYTYQFILNMRLVFTALDKPLLRMERFVIVAALMFFLNWALVVFLVELLDANYLISILIINTTLGLLNFKVEDVWVFSKIPVSKHHRIEQQHARKVRKLILEKTTYSQQL